MGVAPKEKTVAQKRGQTFAATNIDFQRAFEAELNSFASSDSCLALALKRNPEARIAAQKEWDEFVKSASFEIESGSTAFEVPNFVLFDEENDRVETYCRTDTKKADDYYLPKEIKLLLQSVWEWIFFFQ